MDYKDLTLLKLIQDPGEAMDDKTYFVFIDDKTGDRIANCRVTDLAKYFDINAYFVSTKIVKSLRI